MMFKTPSLSIGTANFGTSYGNYQELSISRKEQEHILIDSYENGITSLDTAHEYSNSKNDLGKLEPIKRFGWKITTKLPKIISKLDKKEMFVAVHEFISETKKKFNRTKIDCILIHDPFILENERKLIDILNFLKEIEKDGEIKSYGISTYFPDNNFFCREDIIGDKNFVIQAPYNIFDNRAKAILNSFSKECRVQIRSIFLQGMLTNYKLFKKNFNEHNEIDNYFHWLDDMKISPVEACISYAKYSNADEVIVGFSKLDELNDFLSIYNSVDKITFPNFNISEKVYNPMLWK